MFGRCSIIVRAAVVTTALILVCAFGSSALALRICTFKGVVVDHGWRSMTVKSRGQCAKVNVGWRTKYIPNRRPCLNERVAVDFVLENGHMKATKVVSLTPRSQRVKCYPPPPPSSSVCRTVSEDVSEACGSPKPVCSSRPPRHVFDKNYSPTKKKRKRGIRKRRKGTTKKTVTKVPDPPPPLPKDPPPPPPPMSFTGEVVQSSPKSIAVRVTPEDGSAAVVERISVGLKTKFVPFRRPSVGEKVKVDYVMEDGAKFGQTVQVLQ